MTDLLAMLEICAPGFTITEKKHRHWIRFQGRTYRTLPLGPHGARRNVEVQRGTVRQIVRFFSIPTACVENHLEAMRGLLQQRPATRDR